MACGISIKSNVGYYVQVCSEPGCNDIDLRDIIYDGWMFFLSVNYLSSPECNALWLLMVGRKRFSVKRELISDSRQPEAGNRDIDRKPELWAFTRHEPCHPPHCSVRYKHLITAQIGSQKLANCPSSCHLGVSLWLQNLQKSNRQGSPYLLR